MKHIGIYLSNNTNKNLLYEKIYSNTFLHDHVNLNGLKGALFSSITIDNIIDEEIRHDKFLIQTTENDSLLSMSSGQRRKALLAHIISQKPDFIILDDVFSSIDQNTQQYILNSLEQLSKSVMLIQLFYRRQDVLKSIAQIITVDAECNIIANQTPAAFHEFHHTDYHKHDFTLPGIFNSNYLAINPLISLNSVSASYGEKRVLKNISWTIAPGEFWQLVGSIGSGKSTLLSMIIGDNARGYGEDIMLFGRKKGTGESIWDIKKKIGYFYPAMTFQFHQNTSVENMIISGLVDSVGLYTLPTDLQKKTAKLWMQILDPSFYGKSFNQLSSGQQRILLVVRAMVKKPPLLILDEPIVDLDDNNAQLFIDLVSAIAAEQKVAIIYVSHRNEPMLTPHKILELVPTPEGSVAYIR